MKKWTCKKCGSTDVEIEAWIRPNGVTLVNTVSSIEDDKSYCHKCMEGGHGIVLKEMDEDQNIFGNINMDKSWM